MTKFYYIGSIGFIALSLIIDLPLTLVLIGSIVLWLFVCSQVFEKDNFDTEEISKLYSSEDENLKQEIAFILLQVSSFIFFVIDVYYFVSKVV